MTNGPGLAMSSLSHCQSAPKYSFKGRQEMQHKADTPGPGAYSGAQQGHGGYTSSPKFGFGCSPRETGSSRPMSAPGPGQYTPNDHNTRQKSSEFGFGTSVRKGGARRSEPGPGAYTHSARMGLDGPKFSAGARTEIRNNTLSPGPGAYQHNDPDRNKMESAPKHGFGSSSREANPRPQVPGPGQYNSNDSKLKTSVEYGFSGLSGRRDSGDKRGGPGPGAYEHPVKVGTEGPKYSALGGGARMNKQHGPNTPGPGAYTGGDLSQHKYDGAPKYGFGASPRELSRVATAPGPGQYNPLDENAKPQNPRHGFGTSVRKSSPRSAEMEPGPGAYNLAAKMGSEGPKYSNGGRFAPSEHTASPGPGSYQSHEHMPGNKETSPKFGFGTSERKANSNAAVPGPGSYQEQAHGTFGQLGSSGGSGSKFSFGQRCHISQDSTSPGPGAHNHNSLFA